MRRAAVSLAALAATALIARKRLVSRGGDGSQTVIPVPSRESAHKGLSHDSIDSLGYDWGRTAYPDARPIYPLKVYLPQTTEDVVRAVKEARALGETLRIRGRGHSSNDLVLTDRGSVLLTDRMNAILGLDEIAHSVTVQAGAITAELDAYLGQRGFGLPVIGDHNDITAGGFASVGGISTNSHIHGLFVDNVERLEYVSWEGEVVACSRTERSADFHRLLTGTGQHGVITTLTLRIIPIDKRGTILESVTAHFRQLDEFVAVTNRVMLNPAADAKMLRGIWIVLPFGDEVGFGQLTSYRETEPAAFKRYLNALAYGYLHSIGRLAGRVPNPAERLVKYLGTAGVVFPPKYASIKNVEIFVDRIFDYTADEPARWFIIWGPSEQYEALFQALYRLVLDFRARHRCFTFVSVDVRPFRSAYLAGGDADRLFCEILFYVGIRPERLPAELLDELVRHMDDVCIAHGAYRYMHTLTTKDPDRRRRVDPNTQWARPDTPNKG